MLEIIWTALNSPFGLLVLGFLFTTVAGTIISHEFQRFAHERETRFERLHEERATAIQTLHGMMVDIERDLNDLLYLRRPVGVAPRDIDPISTSKRIQEFCNLVEKSRIFFKPELASQLDQSCRDLSDIFRQMENKILVAGLDPGAEPPEFDEEVFRAVQEDSAKARQRLQAEFQKILGVD